MANLGDTTIRRWGDVFEAVEQCYELGWTDGLPVLPPTDYRVSQFLDYVGRDPAEIVGEISERRREISVGKVAANAVMAGCRTEYFPVVLAVAEAMLDPAFNLIGPWWRRNTGYTQRPRCSAAGHQLPNQPLWPWPPGQRHHWQSR